MTSSFDEWTNSVMANIQILNISGNLDENWRFYVTLTFDQIINLSSPYSPNKALLKILCQKLKWLKKKKS